MSASHFQFRTLPLTSVLMGALLVPAMLIPASAQVQAQDTPAIVPTTEKAPVPAPVADLMAPDDTEPIIESLEFKDIEVSELLVLLSKTFNVDILIPGDIEGRIKFIKISKNTPDQAIKAVVEVAGGLQVRKRDGKYFISKKLPTELAVAEMPANSLPDLPAIRPNNGFSNPTPGEGLASPVLPQLGNGDAFLQNSRSFGTSETPELFKPSRQTRVSQHPIAVKNVKSALMAFWLDPANNPKPIDIVNSEEQAKNYGQRHFGTSALNPNEQQGFTGLGNGFGGGAASNFNPYLQNGATNDGLTETRANFQFGRGGGNNNNRGGGRNGQGGGTLALPEGVQRIIAIDQQNALLVFGTDDGVAELRRTIDFLDQPLKQVEIEAQFVSVTTSDSRAFGINFSSSRGNFSTNNFNFEPAPSAAAGGFQLGFVRNDFQATLTALLNKNRAKVLTAPRVTAINNLTASLQSQRSQPIIITTVSQSIGGQQAQGQQPIYITTNIGLTVTPTINGDGTITVVMQPQLQAQQPSGLAIPIPVITSQTISTIANVRDGETIALGGLKSKEISVGGSKIPLLGDIPGLGKLFRSRSANDSEVELIIFVTARVVHRAGDDDPVPGAD